MKILQTNCLKNGHNIQKFTRFLETKFHSSFQRQTEVNEISRSSTIRSNSAQAMIQNHIKDILLCTTLHNKMSTQPTCKKQFMISAALHLVRAVRSFVLRCV